jgi:Ulp1 protease family, C-terminal catalytic domain
MKMKAKKIIKNMNKTKTRRHRPVNQSNLRCSPNPEKKDFSCFTDESLYQLRDMWNARHPDVLIQTNDTREIWSTLQTHLKSVCSKESCWLKQNFVGNDKSKKLMEESFAPEAPKSWKKKPHEWLSSTDILKVMKQYEKAYKCFEFMGPSPIDYDTKQMYGECVWEELCNFNLKEQIEKGKAKIGIIFNLDPHYLGGSHWVSLFINIKRKTIFYFDSAGDKIPTRIMKFVKTVTTQGKGLGIDFVFDQNYPVEHQYGNTECGIYSIFFIAHMLEDTINEEYLKTHILRDKYMSKFRKVYFN